MADSRAGFEPSDAPEGMLARALDRAAGMRRISGNGVHYLTDGPEIFDAMERFIRDARTIVHFENYIIRHDRTGRRFATALIAAAERGVRVRVVYDAFGCRGTARRFWRALRDRGVDVRAFNPPRLLHPFETFRRDHRKYVGVDGLHAIVGGMCIGDEWAGNTKDGTPPWRDTALAISGPAVPVLDRAFDRQWRRCGGEPITGSTSVDERGQPGHAAVRVVEGLPRQLRMYRVIDLLTSGAGERVWIADAYLVAPTPLLASAMAAARDGVDVRLLVPGRSDVPGLRTLTRVGYRELLEAGVRIWEWQGPMLHAKTAIIDDTWVKVGSSNLNPTSLVSNYELDVIVEEGLTQEAAGQFLRDLERSAEVVLRPPHLPRRVAKHLPPAVVSAGADRLVVTEGPPSLRRRAAVTLRQVTAGMMRTLLGMSVLVLIGVAVLFLALPRLMAYVIAGSCLGLSLIAAGIYLERRKRGD
jgi:cardiolipin synthase A/B